MNVYGAIYIHAKTYSRPNSFTSEQCRISHGLQFPWSPHGTPGTMTPLLAKKTVAFSDLGFPYGSPRNNSTTESVVFFRISNMHLFSVFRARTKWMIS